MGQWSREELEEAFARYEQAVVEIAKTWDWSSYADHFTEDATYVEHAVGNMVGREAIREWIVRTMNMFPGSEMPFYPVSWYSIDTDKGWVIGKIMNRMKDPGDGSILETPVQVRRRRQMELRGRRVQPDEFHGHRAGVHPAVPQTGHHLGRRAGVRQEHESGTD